MIQGRHATVLQIDAGVSREDKCAEKGSEALFERSRDAADVRFITCKLFLKARVRQHVDNLAVGNIDKIADLRKVDDAESRAFKVEMG